MATGDILYDASGNMLLDASGNAIYESDDCCRVKLVSCDDDSVSAYTVTKATADAHVGQVFKRDADGVCYYLGTGSPCAGADAGSGEWFDDCTACTGADCLEDINGASEFGVNPTVNGGCSWAILAPHKLCVNGVNQIYSNGLHSFDFLRGPDNPLSVCVGELYVFVNGAAASGPIAVGDPAVTIGVGAGDRVRIYIDSHAAGLPGTPCAEPGFHDDITTRSGVGGGCEGSCVGYSCPGDCVLPSAVSYDGITLYQDNSVIMDGTSKHYLSDDSETDRVVEITGDAAVCCWILSETYADETFWRGVLSGSCVPQGAYDRIQDQNVHTEATRTVS